MKDLITIGLPSKGRLKDKAISFFDNNNLKILQSEKERNYFGTIENKPNIKVIFLHAKEIIQRLGDGTLDIGISGLDLLDKTPVIDIKPYIPYSDSISTAQCDIASSAPVSNIQVQFEDSTEQILKKWLKKYPSLKQLIEQILIQDPRPAYKQKQNDNNFSIFVLIISL